ncbi:MAG TPA: sigma-70 family RNA polymerase sigma factor [Candidatus Saccharimonadales bacterium]|nr:sigma-70 family RNA polymerase sigma factor [Candidatus Saccharimonadales bacterium]
MPDVNDMALVRQYTDHNSETAFAELVRRHINLVYSVAWRYAGNSHDAQDVAQTVFIVLAQKAATLRHRATLTGWLYETARFTGARLIRTRARQQAREQEAYMQSTLNDSEADRLWRQLAPLLEDAMTRLSERERTVLALRFFENKSGAETAALIGIREWAAHKRTARALEKLRKFFTSRGVNSTTAVIATAISSHSVQAAPMALAKSITAAAIAKGTAAGSSSLSLTKGAVKFMASTHAKTTVVSLIVAGLAALSIVQYQAQIQLRQQNEGLRQQMAQLQRDNEQLSTRRAATPRLPAPQMQAGVPTTVYPEQESPSTNLYARLKDKQPKLTHEQAEAYLKVNGRNAATLLAAFRTSGDPALLKEAMQKYPNDPQVAFEAAFDKGLSPEEQRQWLNTFEKSAPNNALANYLSALNYFNSGQRDQGVQELAAASGKPVQDYTSDRYQTDAEAYLAAGYSEADAKTISGMQLLLPQLGQLKQLGLDTVDLANAYRQAGDAASAQTALQMAAEMGQHYASPSPGEAEVSQLVGIAIERIALNAMDSNSPYGNNGQTVQDQLNQLAQQRDTINTIEGQLQPLLPQLSDQDWINYRDRWLMFGEENAESWVIGKYGQVPP